MPEERRVAAWIGAQIVIKGDLTSSEDLTIAGQVDGNVAARSHTLTVAPDATINGDIVARAVALHGRVTGTITASSMVDVGPTASVEGAVTAPRMVIAEGAALNGPIAIGGSATAS